MPKILLMDEPSLGLAPSLVIQVFKTVEKLKEKKITILLVEQNVYMGLQVADYVYVIETGKIAMQGPKEVIESNERIRKSYLGI